MTAHHCLSLLELVELRGSAQEDWEEGQRNHVAQCQRCALLLELIGAGTGEDLDDFGAAEPSPQLAESMVAAAQLARERARATADSGERTRTGDLWLVPVSEDENEVVAVVGKRRDAEELLWVTPITTETENAAEGDVLIDDAALGYEAMLCAWNSGAIRSDQLETYRGRLDPDARVALAEAFTAFASGDESLAPVGRPAIVGPDDPRLSWRNGFQDRLRAVYEVVDRELDSPADRDHSSLESETLPEPPVEEIARRGTRVRVRPSPTRQPTRTSARLFSAYLAEQMDQAGWDEVGLAERAELETRYVTAFLGDQFELERQGDVEPLAAVIGIVARDQDTDEILQGPLRQSLERLEGGTVRAKPDHDLPLAAGSYANVDESKRNADLHTGLYDVDRSETGHRQAVESYIAAVRDLLV